MRTVLALCWLLGSLSGCHSRDNPADPGRCDPPCEAGETCWNGQCVTPDGGLLMDGTGTADGTVAADQTADAGPAAPSMFYKKCMPGAATQTSATSVSTILCKDGDFSVKVTANGTDRYLFILSIPDNYMEHKLGDYKHHTTATFALEDNGEFVGATGYGAPHGQHVPITLVAMRTLSAGEHTIEAQWRMDTAGVLKHGPQPSWLMVIRADPQDLQAVYGPDKQQSMAPSQDWTDIPKIPSITIPQPGGDYLLILTTPPAGADHAGAPVQYRIRRVHDGTDMAIGDAHVMFTAGAQNQGFPITLVEATNLQGGDVIRAQWKNYSSGKVTTAAIGGTANVGWLVALRTPKGILSQARTTYDEKSTTSNSPVAVPDLPPLEVASKGGNHLLVLQAHSTTCSYAPYYTAGFELLVDGVAEAQGTFSAHGNSNILPCQTIPVTLFAAKDLAQGKHNITARWRAAGKGYSDNDNKVTVAKLLALTR